jgi:hypothetical protein
VSETIACPTSKFIHYTCDSKDARRLCGFQRTNFVTFHSRSSRINNFEHFQQYSSTPQFNKQSFYALIWTYETEDTISQNMWHCGVELLRGSTLAYIQRVSGGIVNILGGGSMDNSE